MVSRGMLLKDEVSKIGDSRGEKRKKRLTGLEVVEEDASFC